MAPTSASWKTKNLLLCLELGVEFWNRMKSWFPKNFASIIVIEVKGVASSSPRDVIRANYDKTYLGVKFWCHIRTKIC